MGIFDSDTIQTPGVAPFINESPTIIVVQAAPENKIQAFQVSGVLLLMTNSIYLFLVTLTALSISLDYYTTWVDITISWFCWAAVATKILTVISCMIASSRNSLVVLLITTLLLIIFNIFESGIVILTVVFAVGDGNIAIIIISFLGGVCLLISWIFNFLAVRRSVEVNQRNRQLSQFPEQPEYQL